MKSLPRRTFRSVGAALALSLATTGCGGAATALGPSPAAARTQADDLFAGLAVRFDDVQRAPKFAAGRSRLARYALAPSRLVGDTSVWTSMPADGSRWLELVGRPVDGRYWFLPQAAAPAPSRPGESRHVMRLEPKGDGVYLWNTAVEHAVGRVRAADVGEALVAALARLERPEGEVRGEVHGRLARSAAAWGRLCTLDSVRSVSLADGSSMVDVRISLHPDRLRRTMPDFAAYVEKYVTPARYVITLGDGRGARWLDARAARNVLTFRMRLRRGELLALDGPARPLPDAFEMRVDAFAHFLIFDVGVTEMVGDVATLRGPHERGWSFRWRRAPRWHLPLAVRHFIAGPLDRPFAGEGMRLALSFRDADAGQTLLVRRFDVAVQESAIVRWLGGLGFRAMDDFAGRAEVEENRFLAEGLYALRADAVAAVGAP